LMQNQGFDYSLMNKICHQNWIGLIKKILI
jgi:hypothetical protein